MARRAVEEMAIAHLDTGPGMRQMQRVDTEREQRAAAANSLAEVFRQCLAELGQ